MFGYLDKYIAVFLTGFVVTYLLTPIARKLALRFGVVDMPDERRPHKRPTARGGGIAVVLGVYAAAFMWLAFPWPGVAGGFELNWWRHVLAGSLVLTMVGLIDDIRGLRPLVKLAGQAVAGIIVYHGGTRFGEFFGVDLPAWLDGALVVIWLVGVINAFNLIDGMDGLASGLACISAAGLCGVFIINHLPGDVLALLGLVGACLAFLRYNFHPATIFLGDTGSMFIGFLLGVVSLQSFNKSTFLLSLSIPMLVLGIPIYDTLLAIWRRSVRMWLHPRNASAVEKGLGIMQPDLDHLHHRLLRTGLNTRRVATLLWIGNAALVVFGLLISTFKSHASGIFLIALLGGAYVLMRHLALIELRDTGAALLQGLRRPTSLGLKSLAFPAWDMFWLSAAVAVAMWITNEAPEGFWRRWFVDLPVWVTPTVSLLALSNAYVTVWSRSRMRDVLSLLFTLQAGLLLSLGIALLIDPYGQKQRWLIWTLVTGAVSHPAILLPRVIYRFVEELVSWAKGAGPIVPDGRRVVLYGAGGRCWLFLRELSFNNFDGRVIVGVIDDDPDLRLKKIYGYTVLGKREDLPRLIRAHNLTGVIITATLTLESRTALQDIVLSHGIHCTEWRCEEIEANFMTTPHLTPVNLV
jgi:UDP-N-acetylmuramyl pentapeptide phosphotransferase/UDP-N-acetylglucosamine-1-phosphate transferase